MKANVPLVVFLVISSFFLGVLWKSTGAPPAASSTHGAGSTAGVAPALTSSGSEKTSPAGGPPLVSTKPQLETNMVEEPLASLLLKEGEPDKWLAFMSSLVTMVAEVDNPGFNWFGMGNIGQCMPEMLAFLAAGKKPGIRTICEVGFNAGHSAVVLMVSNRNAKLLEFDLGDMKHALIARDFFNRVFPGQMTYVQGDSLVEVPRYTTSHPDLRCDVLSIDGVHTGEWPGKDLHALRAFSHTGAVVLMDDSTMDAVRNAWNDAKSRKQVEEINCIVGGKAGQADKAWCEGTVLEGRGVADYAKEYSERMPWVEFLSRGFVANAQREAPSLSWEDIEKAGGGFTVRQMLEYLAVLRAFPKVRSICDFNFATGVTPALFLVNEGEIKAKVYGQQSVPYASKNAQLLSNVFRGRITYHEAKTRPEGCDLFSADVAFAEDIRGARAQADMKHAIVLLRGVANADAYNAAVGVAGEVITCYKDKWCLGAPAESSKLKS